MIVPARLFETLPLLVVIIGPCADSGPALHDMSQVHFVTVTLELMRCTLGQHMTVSKRGSLQNICY
jgi:hypothetical protein